MFQHVIAQFVFFLFLNYCCSYYFKNISAKFYPQQFHELGESAELLSERTESHIAPSIFDGSNDLFSSGLMFISLSFVPFTVGLCIGRSPHENYLLLISYSLYRICGSISLCKTLDQKGTSGILSWLSLGWYASTFPCGIIIGSWACEPEPSSALVLLCSFVAAALIYDIILELLPRAVKSSDAIYTAHGEWNVFAAFTLTLILFLIFASKPPTLTVFPPIEDFTPAPTAWPTQKSPKF